MTKEELRALLYQNELGRVADQLIDLAAPTIRIHEQGIDEADIPIGTSKLGGCPDLPEGVAWPAWHESMAFIAQINLADAAPYDTEQVLPPYGLLSFFYETDGEPLHAERWGLPEDAPYVDDYGVDVSQSWRVLYHPADPATFQRREIPPDLNEWVRYGPSIVRFALERTLPSADGPEMGSLELTKDERSTLSMIENMANRGADWKEGGHHLLGYPFNMGGPALLSCGEEARHVWDVWGNGTPEERLHMQRDAAAKWRLLLQVSGSNITDMSWGGAGVLHICITHEALRARDFSGVWFDMQFL